MLIKLHGFMGKKYAKSVTLAAENMFQLMAGLQHRFGPEFRADVKANDWHLIKGKISSKKDIGEDELTLPLNTEVLHLVPVVAGASGALRIVIGAVLVVAGLYFGQSWMVNMGATMILGGVSELLTKQNTNSPKQSERSGDTGSVVYNGALNVTSQGGPVPLVYGRVNRASSVVISTDFSTDQL